MSNMSQFHNTEVYTPNKSKALEGQRLSKHSWKTPKNADGSTGVKPESKCVSIPKISYEAMEKVGDALQPHIVAYLETVQDAMIKEMIVAGKTEIHDEQISMAAVIEYLEAETQGTRFTKADAEKWFTEVIEDTLALTLASKLGVSEVPTENESKQIFAIVGEFKGKITGLAGGKTSYSGKVAANLQKALDLVEDKEDPIYVRFSKRLEKMQETEMDLLNLL